MTEVKDSQRLSKEEAIEEAIRIQHALYGYDSIFLRQYMGFSADLYQQIDDHRDIIKIIRTALRSLPSVKNELSLSTREWSVGHLCDLAGSEAVITAWSEVLYKQIDYTPDLKKFIDNGSLLFESIEANFRLMAMQPQFGITYNHPAPSSDYIILLKYIYDMLEGGSYDNPEQLLSNFKTLLKGKHILELGPGPGWFMAILQNLGAVVYGIDIELFPEVIKNYNLDIRQGNVNQLSGMFDEQFDIVISNNFMTSHGVGITPPQAEHIVMQILDKLRPGGFSVHSMEYTHIPLEYFLIIYERTQSEYEVKKFREIYDQSSEAEQTSMLLSNECPIEADEIINLGAESVKFIVENGNFTFSFRK
jgi:SAM-dependent methyltransferase